MTAPPELIKLLSHDLRWGLLKALAASDQRVQELVILSNQPMNLVSYHLKKLRDEQIVTTRRSEADGRDVYYSLDLDRLRMLYQAAGSALHPALGTETIAPFVAPALPQLRVLFVCTHNSARSQMAQALLSQISQRQLEVLSAGSQPTAIHPDAVRTMQQFGIDIRQQQTHALRDYADESFDYVITVCDRAREVCPTFPGAGKQFHWGFPDPVMIQDDAQRREAFLRTAHRLKSRIEYFLRTLPPFPPFSSAEGVPH